MQRLLPEAGARRASHNCSAAMGEGGEKSRSDFRDGVRCAWAKPSLDAITTNSALIGSGSPATLPAPCARPTRAMARDASRFRRQRMKARVLAFVLFERRQLTKFTRAESWRVLDMDFLEDGIFVA